MKNKPFQSGMTLIEILIALLIGAFLLGGVLQIFVGSKQTNSMQENLSRLQENGRFAMDFLAKDIRMAGYWACMSPTTPNEDIAGTEGALGAADSITLRGAFVRIPTGTCGIAVTKAPTVACGAAAPVNFYSDTTSIITYSITNGALRRATNCITNANADIVEGIENMQILYGVDTDLAGNLGYGTPNYFVSADNVPDMAKVISVRITLTASTIDGNLTTTGDGKIRRTFTSTIAVRNRLP